MMLQKNGDKVVLDVSVHGIVALDAVFFTAALAACTRAHKLSTGMPFLKIILSSL